jgi:hypothetical protein
MIKIYSTTQESVLVFNISTFPSIFQNFATIRLNSVGYLENVFQITNTALHGREELCSVSTVSKTISTTSASTVVSTAVLALAPKKVTLIKKKTKFSSYIGKFRWDREQIHI